MSSRENTNDPLLPEAKLQHEQDLPEISSISLNPTNKPVVIGVYGLPGSGKTFLLNQLREKLRSEPIAFFEGSEIISTVVPDGLEAFKKLKDEERLHWRQTAIRTIRDECIKTGRVGIVTGHFMFWSEEEKEGNAVYTQDDLDIFTHILYLNVPAEIIENRRLDDKARNRPLVSVGHIQRWQQAEQTQLRTLCHDNTILFSAVSLQSNSIERIVTLLRDFQQHNENHNLLRAKNELNKIFSVRQVRLKTVLVLDADKTLAAEDTGVLFWEKYLGSQPLPIQEWPLKSLFSSSLGYSYNAFRQAALLYEDATPDHEYDAICQDVASKVSMYPEFVSLLHLIEGREDIAAVIITCGLRRVWEKVLEREGLSETVKIIGGGRIEDELVVTAAVKGALVTHLKEVHHVNTWAFGDGPLDIEMMRKADHAIVVVGTEKARSKGMDAVLTNAINHQGLKARQVVLPSNSLPRLDTVKLPMIQLAQRAFVDSILGRSYQKPKLRVVHVTERSSTKLLRSRMRDAKSEGPALREAHRQVGFHLAHELLADEIGTEAYPILHVQGHFTTGTRLLHEKQTSIVALMRGGEPMAFGVNDAFPLAMFIHAKDPRDIKLHHLEGQHNLVLVDSVVNSGKTIAQFVERVRSLNATIRIVVVAGVVQADSITSGGYLEQSLPYDARLNIVALRLSDNKFGGTGGTDTGNRLFNTTHLA